MKQMNGYKTGENYSYLGLLPCNPIAAIACFSDTLLSSPRLLPVVNSTKSICRCGVASSMCKCAKKLDVLDSIL